MSRVIAGTTSAFTSSHAGRECLALEDAMKVRELKAILATKEDDANVYMMVGGVRPWEHAILGVEERRDFEDEERTWPGLADLPDPRATDLFIVQGRRLRLG